MIRTILKDEDPKLKQISKDVSVIDERTVSLVRDLIETVNHKRGLGLAAPQVGVNYRVIVAKIDGYYTPMINPVILETSGEIIDSTEGCFSVSTGLYTVERSSSITVSYKDLNGLDKSLALSGLASVIVQHEIDHLNGKLISNGTKY